MWLMLQQDQPDDYVIATGEKHSVRELVELAFAHVGLDWQKYVVIDPALSARPKSTRSAATATKARDEARLEARGHASQSWSHMMVDADLERPSAAKLPSFRRGRGAVEHQSSASILVSHSAC